MHGLEWPGAQLEADANLARVGATAEHPILLGPHPRALRDLYFPGQPLSRGARGILIFANPFRLNPVINVEATTTIQQYEITPEFHGGGEQA